MIQLLFIIPVFTLVSTFDPESYGIEPLTPTPEVIVKYGYPAETHHVTTEDGYIITLFRIPNSPKSSKSPNKVAILHHGLSSTSRDWVYIGPENSLGFLLADEGYDVWLMNYRGSFYSRNHTSLTPSNRKFWDFSFHEMGVYDTPASVDYIINKTGIEEHYHVGISMGCTVFFVFAAARPQYNKNIKLLVAEGPSVLFNGEHSAIFSSFAEFGLSILKALGINEFLPSRMINTLLSNTLCKNNLTRVLCANALFLGTGFDPKQLDEPHLYYVATHIPTGISIRTAEHYLQIRRSGKFQQFDFGKLNMQKYGRPTPPEYNLKDITAPVSILYADNDIYYDVNDVFEICKTIQNCVELYRIPSKTFTHFGFVYANDVKTLVNDVVMEHMRKY